MATEPRIKWVPENLSPGVKRMGCDNDHSPPISINVKNGWSYNSTPPHTHTMLSWC